MCYTARFETCYKTYPGSLKAEAIRRLISTTAVHKMNAQLRERVGLRTPSTQRKSQTYFEDNCYLKVCFKNRQVNFISVDVNATLAQIHTNLKSSFSSQNNERFTKKNKLL